MTLQPVGEWVLCEILPGDTMSAGGIVIPKVAREGAEIRRAKVLAVGPGVPLTLDAPAREVRVQVGDVVHYRADRVERFEQLGKAKVFVRAQDCLLRETAA